MHLDFSRLIVLLQVGFAFCALAQVPGAPQTVIEKHEIDLTQSVPLIGLPATGAFAYPNTCSSDGDIYTAELVFDQEGRPISKIPDLYRISVHAEVKNIPKPVPPDHQQIDSPGFYAGAHLLVSLIRASLPTNRDGGPHPGTDLYLSESDPDGGTQTSST